MTTQPGQGSPHHGSGAWPSADATAPLITPGCIIAGVSSSVGKTTTATGLMAALTARGPRVQPFKVSPDSIDPSHHAAVCGRPSRNLNAWMVGEPATTELYQRAVADADIAIVEGVMGLYNSRSGGGEQGSPAQVAKLLGLPVLLVVDARAMARTAGAVALGARAFDPTVRIGGVLLNGVASERHVAAVRDAVEHEAGTPVLGTLPHEERLALLERHLGLIPVAEGRTAEEFFTQARDLAARHIDLDRVLGLATIARSPRLAAPTPSLFPSAPQPARARIAVARDRAFSFSSADSFDPVRAWGAEQVPFSPLADDDLSPGCSAVYIGGGFPELFADQLAASVGMRTALRRAAARGRVIYGECGGLMYLGETLTDASGRTHSMVGVLPLSSTMHRSRLTLAYWEFTTRIDPPLDPAGRRLRGHEFHWSVPDRAPSPEEALYELEGSGRLAGMRRDSVYGSYIHLHLGSNPSLAPAFVSAAAACEAGL